MEGHNGHVSWRGFTLVQRDAFLCASCAIVTAVQLQVKGQAGDTHDTTQKSVSSWILVLASDTHDTTHKSASSGILMSPSNA